MRFSGLSRSSAHGARVSGQLDVLLGVGELGAAHAVDGHVLIQQVAHEQGAAVCAVAPPAVIQVGVSQQDVVNAAGVESEWPAFCSSSSRSP